MTFERIFSFQILKNKLFSNFLRDVKIKYSTHDAMLEKGLTYCMLFLYIGIIHAKDKNAKTQQKLDKATNVIWDKHHMATNVISNKCYTATNIICEENNQATNIIRGINVII